MKNDKIIKLDGRLVPVSMVMHWQWDDSLDAPYSRRLNYLRWQTFNKVVKAWRTLDSTLFKDVLTGNHEYGSYWVNDIMYGCDSYCDYISAKFETIRTKGVKPDISIVVIREALNPQRYSYAIHMKQGDIETLLIFTFEKEKISQMYMTDPDIFTFDDYHFENYEIKILDKNGDPRMFKHTAAVGCDGNIMSDREFQTFAMDIATTFFRETSNESGIEIVSINQSPEENLPNFIFTRKGRQIYCKLDMYTAPATKGTKTVDNSKSFIQRTHDYDALAMILPLGLFCMNTNGQRPLCGATFAAKFLPGLTV